MFGNLRLYLFLAIMLAFVGISTTAYIYYLKYQNAGIQLEQAVEVNKANTRAAKELREDWAADKAATEKELAETQKRASAIDDIKRELENAPDAQSPAGPFWDELAKRLQSLSSGTTD